MPIINWKQQKDKVKENLEILDTYETQYNELMRDIEAGGHNFQTTNTIIENANRIIEAEIKEIGGLSFLKFIF